LALTIAPLHAGLAVNGATLIQAQRCVCHRPLATHHRNSLLSSPGEAQTSAFYGDNCSQQPRRWSNWKQRWVRGRWSRGHAGGNTEHREL